MYRKKILVFLGYSLMFLLGSERVKKLLGTGTYMCNVKVESVLIIHVDDLQSGRTSCNLNC